MAKECKQDCMCGKHARGQSRTPYCRDCGWVGTPTISARAKSNMLRWHKGLGRDFAAARAVPLCPNAAVGYASMTTEEIKVKWPITCASERQLKEQMTDAILEKFLDVMAGISARYPYRAPKRKHVA